MPMLTMFYITISTKKIQKSKRPDRTISNLHAFVLYDKQIISKIVHKHEKQCIITETPKILYLTKSGLASVKMSTRQVNEV